MSILEIIPIILAFAAIYVSANATMTARRSTDRIRAGLSVVAAVLLIVAQTSWYVTSVILGQMEDTSFANHIWSVFNILVMLIIILFPGHRVIENAAQKTTPF